MTDINDIISYMAGIVNGRNINDRLLKFPMLKMADGDPILHPVKKIFIIFIFRIIAFFNFFSFRYFEIFK